MNAYQSERTASRRPDYGFAIGLLAGAVAGAGLALCFAPRLAAELRERVMGTAGDLRQRAADRYTQMSASVGNAAAALAEKGQDVRDSAANAVAAGAHEVERLAKASRSR